MIGRGSRGESSSQREEAIVFEALTTHASALLRTARRYSLCTDDAHDAYQRALEILLRRVGSLDPDRAIGWLHTVVKHEAMAVRRSRQELVGSDEIDLERVDALVGDSPEDRVIGWEDTSRAAEAFRRLKPQERKALWLKATGLSYAEIASRESWTYTKVNRCLSEGRKSFLARYAGIESGAECERWAPLLSALVDGEATAEDLAEVRPHLRNCASCRATVRELHNVGRSVAAVLPPALAGAAGSQVLQSGLGRLWDALHTYVAERATTIAVKAQLAGDALGGGKMAAVAASAAAVASGGAVIADQARVNEAPAATHQTARPIEVRQQVPRTKRVSAPVATPIQRPNRNSEFGRQAPAAHSDQVAAEFGPERASSSAAPTSASTGIAQSESTSSSAQNGGEFDP